MFVIVVFGHKLEIRTVDREVAAFYDNGSVVFSYFTKVFELKALNRILCDLFKPRKDMIGVFSVIK